jgi:imidazolonepropionase-like amidohydrolase
VSGSLLLATTLAFRGGTLIDGTGAPPIRNALLVIRDGRIVSVGAATAEALKALPAGTEVLSADGKWIIPGLIDAHVHAESEEDLRTMLRWGVTSVRLMAEDVAAAEKLAAASKTRDDIPEVFPAAPIFTTRGGWWDQGEPADANLNRYPATPAEARESVRKAKALGSREIKVMLDDMAWCRAPKPPLPKMPPAVMTALISEARTQGLRATVHAPNLADAKAAIAAGATALAHGVLEPIDEATIAVMKSRPVFYIPTMDIFEFLADTRGFVDGVLGPVPKAPAQGSGEFHTHPGLDDWLLPATLERLRSPAYSDGYRERYPNFDFVRQRLPALRENLKRLHDAGVPISLGTDMWAFPGLAVSVELELYGRAGLTRLEAIRAATQTAARSLGIEQDRGTLEAGRRADFLVLRSSPEWLHGLQDIDGTWKAGARVGPMTERRGP